MHNYHPCVIYDAYKAIIKQQVEIRQQVELKIKRSGKILMSGFKLCVLTKQKGNNHNPFTAMTQ
jgi:hypothetical protein